MVGVKEEHDGLDSFSSDVTVLPVNFLEDEGRFRQVVVMLDTVPIRVLRSGTLRKEDLQLLLRVFDRGGIN